MDRDRALGGGGSGPLAGDSGHAWRRLASTGVAAVALLGGAAATGLPVGATSVRSAQVVNPVARFLSVDSAQRMVTLTLLAGFKSASVNGFDFNGYAAGALTVSTPKGWKVIVHCESRGSGAHSCAIVANAKATTPAFIRASTTKPSQGIPAGRSATFSFVPTRVGHFLLASLVRGQVARGMWDHFNVTAAGIPSIAATAATTGAAEVLSIAASPDGALRYTKAELIAPRPGKITIKFTNNSPIVHDFTLATPAGVVIAHTPVFIGGTRSLTVTLKAGVYGFYCSVDHHELAGMQGTLIVK